MYKLIISCNDKKVDEVVLRREAVTVGRRKDNDIRLDDNTVSGHHAQFSITGDKVYVEDLGSTNGTYVNGQRVEARALEDGDVVIIGKHKFTVRARTEESRADMADPTLQIETRELERLLASAQQAMSGRHGRKVLNWIAQDPRGAWWGFEHQPHPDEHGWVDARNGVRILLKEDARPAPNWRETLQKI